MSKVILFAGTTEGRLIARSLSENNIDSTIFVATEYGAEILDSCELGPSITVIEGRQNSEQIYKILLNLRPQIIIDSTHPYAEIVSENIISAAEKLPSELVQKLKILRVVRPISDQNTNTFDSLEEMIKWINTKDDIVFSGLGIKEAGALRAINNYQKRVVLRILPFMDSLKSATELGYSSANIICMQGPFSEEINLALFRKHKAGILITKDTGKTGGFIDKINAAKQNGMEIGILKRPDKVIDFDNYDEMTLEEILNFIQNGENL